MFLKKYKSKCNSLRNRVLLKLKKYTKFKRLLCRLKKNNGKNYLGHIVSKRRGGGYFYKYRIIDKFYYKNKEEFRVLGFDYSYYNSGLLALLQNKSGVTKYYLVPENLTLDNKIITTFFFKSNFENLGHSIPIGWIPNNVLIYNLENKPFSGSKLIKSAGSYGKIISHTNNKVKIMLPSKKMQYFSKYCMASIGRVSNIFNKFQNLSKAGLNHNLNIRPRVSGESMNSVDHPNGGRTKRGKPIKNYWGKIIK